MNISFVTSVYDDLSNTKFAGRHNRGTQYAFSLAQMQHMGVPIYIFTDKRNIQKNLPAIYSHSLDNAKFINYELDKYPLYNDIQKIKDSNPEVYRNEAGWSSRCVEIMWSKFDLVEHIINKVGISEDNFVFWIDAGLSHPGVLPYKYNSIYNPEMEYPNQSKEYHDGFYFDQIFNNEFPEYLANYIGKNKIFHMMCNSPQHNDPSFMGNIETVKTGTVVGGLFGGTTNVLLDWVLEGKDICQQLVDHNQLVKEEDILSYMVNKHMVEDESFIDEKIKLYLFDTWYHEDWLKNWDKTLYDPNTAISFSDFFKEFTGR